MTIEVRPMGVACNISCTYCYQEPMRAAGNIHTKYDMDKIFAEIDRANRPFNLFGGEALLIPKEDLRKFFEYGFKKFGRNGLQTNGTLIDEDHIQMFKEFNVSPGISIDGPGDLNSLRWAGSEDKTLEYTNKTIENIKKLKDNGINTGIIITLHRKNGYGENLTELLQFMRWLGDIGVKGGNIHTLEVDSTMPESARENVLTQEENAFAILEIAKFLEVNKDLSWNPFREIPSMLVGKDEGTSCNFNYCDPGDTNAVYGIEGDGALSNCGRTNKEGIDLYKADRHSYARYISFYNTPDEYGGCKGCRFWMVCGGSCPGEADSNDFRNKTIHCYTQKRIINFYEYKLEQQGITPVTKSKDRAEIEKIMLNELAKGNKTSISQALRRINERGVK